MGMHTYITGLKVEVVEVQFISVQIVVNRLGEDPISISYLMPQTAY
jgi:hypothetical protein